MANHFRIIFISALALFGTNFVDSATIYTDNAECYTDTRDFTTYQAVTQSGLECQRWDRQAPHEHEYRDEQFTDGSMCKAKNYCRDPGDDGFFWCYTMDPDTRWEACGIPWCDEPPRNNNTQDCYHITDLDTDSGMSTGDICRHHNASQVCEGKHDAPGGCGDCDGCCQTKDCSDEYVRLYSGTWHRGESGRDCQHWDSQFPHKHENDDSWKFPEDDSVMAAQNYCRDPEYSDFLWCYTMDPNVRWEKCDIPIC